MYVHKNGVYMPDASNVTGVPTSGASRTITSITTPEFEPRSADILYVENITPVTRVDGQAEDIRLVLQF